MGRAPCCDKAKVKRGPWSPEEDTALKNYVHTNGTGGNWIALPHKAGLKRCGKSCRLRWLNYLRPDIKHGGFTEEEDNIICTLYKSIGSRWSVIASQLPGRTDNDVKNHWNTKLKKKLLAAKTSVIHQLCSSSSSSSSSPTLLTTKHEIDNYGAFSTCFNHQNSTTLIPPPSMDFAGLLGQAADHSQRLVDLEDPIHHYFPHQPGLMEAPKLGQNADINSTTDRNIVSSCQEISGLSSVASSSFNLDENFFLWSGNGGGDHEDNGFSSMGFEFSSYLDNNEFFGFHQERIIANEADAANLANSLSDNFLGDPSDAKSQLGLYQSIANYGFSSTMS